MSGPFWRFSGIGGDEEQTAQILREKYDPETDETVENRDSYLNSNFGRESRDSSVESDRYLDEEIEF